jgi:hypothetical protein
MDKTPFFKSYKYFNLPLERDLDGMDLRWTESSKKHCTREWHKLRILKYVINNNHSEFRPNMIIGLLIMLTTPVNIVSTEWSFSKLKI